MHDGMGAGAGTTGTSIHLTSPLPSPPTLLQQYRAANDFLPQLFFSTGKMPEFEPGPSVLVPLSIGLLFTSKPLLTYETRPLHILASSIPLAAWQVAGSRDKKRVCCRQQLNFIGIHSASPFHSFRDGRHNPPVDLSTNCVSLPCQPPSVRAVSSTRGPLSCPPLPR